MDIDIWITIIAIYYLNPSICLTSHLFMGNRTKIEIQTSLFLWTVSRLF